MTLSPSQNKLTALYLHDAECAGAELDGEIAALTRRREWFRKECTRLRGQLNPEPESEPESE